MEAKIYIGDNSDWIKLYSEKDIKRLVDALYCPVSAPVYMFFGSEKDNDTLIIKTDAIKDVIITGYVPNFLKEDKED